MEKDIDLLLCYAIQNKFNVILNKFSKKLVCTYHPYKATVSITFCGNFDDEIITQVKQIVSEAIIDLHQRSTILQKEIRHIEYYTIKRGLIEHRGR